MVVVDVVVVVDVEALVPAYALEESVSMVMPPTGHQDILDFLRGQCLKQSRAEPSDKVRATLKLIAESYRDVTPAYK